MAMFFVSAALAAGLLRVLSSGPRNLVQSGAYAVGRAEIYQMMNINSVKMAGVFMISASTISLHTRIVPRWITLLGYVLALLLLVMSARLNGFRWSFRAIEAALLRNTSMRALAEKYGLASHYPLHRHRKHLPERLTLAKHAEDVAAASTLLQRVEGVIGECKAIIDSAKKGKDWSAAVAALREIPFHVFRWYPRSSRHTSHECHSRSAAA